MSQQGHLLEYYRDDGLANSLEIGDYDDSHMQPIVVNLSVAAFLSVAVVLLGLNLFRRLLVVQQVREATHETHT